MKKLYFALFAALTIILCGCSSNSPSHSVSKALDALCSEDYDTFVSYLCGPYGEIYDDDQQMNMANAMSWIFSPGMFIEDYEIIDEAIDAGEAEVRVKFTFPYNRSIRTKLSLVQCDDGVWRINMDPDDIFKGN